MLRPRPVVEALQRPVTAGTALAAIGVTSASWLGYSVERLTDDPSMFWAEPWRLVTSALVHADVIHLAFNVYWLWVFGALLEATIGGALLLGLMLLLAAGSGAAEYALFHGGVGLSGVGYGLFGALVVLSRRDRRFVDAMDQRTIALFAIWFFVCIAATWTGVWRIANVAHGGGAVLGALFGLAIAHSKTIAPRLAGAVGALALTAACLAGASVGRSYVNFTDAAYWDAISAGNDAADAGRVDDAIAHYRRAIDDDGARPEAWFNLGIALETADREAEALSAFEQAHARTPDNTKYRQALAERLAKNAYAMSDDRLPEQCALYTRSVELEPNVAATWFNLALCQESMGRKDDAQRSYARALKLDPKLER